MHTMIIILLGLLLIMYNTQTWHSNDWRTWRRSQAWIYSSWYQTSMHNKIIPNNNASPILWLEKWRRIRYTWSILVWHANTDSHLEKYGLLEKLQDFVAQLDTLPSTHIFPRNWADVMICGAYFMYLSNLHWVACHGEKSRIRNTLVN